MYTNCLLIPVHGFCWMPPPPPSDYQTPGSTSGNKQISYWGLVDVYHYYTSLKIQPKHMFTCVNSAVNIEMGSKHRENERENSVQYAQ